MRGKVNLASYDRLFPSQDLLPVGGVGNLIALPLFRSARDRNATVFLNLENLEPHQDQWSYLSTLGRMTPKEVSRAADQAGRVPAGREVTGLPRQSPRRSGRKRRLRSGPGSARAFGSRWPT